MPFITARVVSVVVTDAIAALADAGPNQSVLCASLVQLQAGIIGDDIANHTFEWEQTFGTPVTLINANTLTPSFVNPQVSDLEFTFYLDRNTPFEDSDVVFVSRAPETRQSDFGGGTGAISSTSSASTESNMSGTNENLLNTRAHVTGWGYVNPPTARYSPIFEASDLDRVRENLAGDYWLMRDIDLSGYANWDPIGTATRPFSGDFQGNGFVIDNLTITDTPIANSGGDNFASNVTMNNDFEGTDGDQTYTGSFGDVWTFDNDANISTDQFVTGATSLHLDGTGDRVFTPNGPGLFGSGDFTVELNAYPLTDASSQWITSLHSGTSNRSWYLQMGTNNAIIAVVERSGGSAIIITTSINLINENEWTHVALMRKGTGIYLFRNGVLVGSDVGTIGASETVYQNGVTPTTDLYIGRRPGSLTHFGGYVDNFRLTKAARYPVTGFATPTTFPAIVRKDAGLFSRIGSGANVQDVGITNASITGVSDALYKGIIVGSAQGAATDDGGIVTITDCWTEGTVDDGGDLAGGLIGHTGANVSSTFTNTYADVTVTGGGTNTGGWAGNFQTEGTYVENYGNTTKTTTIVGTGGDTPIAGEVEGRSSSELLDQSQYTNWDFISTWELTSTPLSISDPFFGQVAFLADFDGDDLDTTYTEQSLNRASGTFINQAQLTTAAAEDGSTGLALDGAADSVQFPFSTRIGLQEFTIEASIYVAAASTGIWNNIVAHFEEPGSNRGWYFAYDNGVLRMGWSDDGINTWLASVSYSIPADTYVKVAAERTGTDQLSFYVNGTQQGTTQTMTNPDIRLPTGSQALWIGDLDAGAATDFEGRIDNVRVTIGTARYRGDYTPATTAFDGVSSATLQRDTRIVRAIGACDDNWMIAWQNPNNTEAQGRSPLYEFKGTIIEEAGSGGWSFPRFIPKNRFGGLMTPDTTHRITGVWDFSEESAAVNPGRGQSPRELRIVHNEKFTSKNTSPRFGPYGNDAVTAFSGSNGFSNNLVITISNPRKISKQDEVLQTFGFAGGDAATNNLTLFRGEGAHAAPVEDPATTYGFGGTTSVNLNLVIVRANGASIG